MKLTQLERRHYLMGFILVLAMVAVATIIGDSEVILPEIGALTAGTWIYQKPGWVRQPFKLFLAPSGTAVIGFLINLLPWAYPLKVLVGIALMLLLLKGLRTTLAPSFATGLLPIIINATHLVFIVAILFWTLTLMTGVWLQQRQCPVAATQTAPTIQRAQMGGFALLILLWVLLVWVAGLPQMAAIPPVIVVLFEAIQQPYYPAKMAAKQWLVLTLAATIGVGVHLLISSWLLTTVVALPLVWLLLALLKMKVPAAYAFPLLGLVLPVGMFKMLPISAALSAGFLFGGLWLYRVVTARVAILTDDDQEE